MGLVLDEESNGEVGGEFGVVICEADLQMGRFLWEQMLEMSKNSLAIDTLIVEVIDCQD